MLRILSTGAEKINIRIENNRGETPFDKAVVKRYWRVVDWMIDQAGGGENLSGEERERILTVNFSPRSNGNAHISLILKLIRRVEARPLNLAERKAILTTAFTVKRQTTALQIIRSMGELSGEEQSFVSIRAVEKGWGRVLRLLKFKALVDHSESVGFIKRFFSDFCHRRF